MIVCLPFKILYGRGDGRTYGHLMCDFREMEYTVHMRRQKFFLLVQNGKTDGYNTLKLALKDEQVEKNMSETIRGKETRKGGAHLENSKQSRLAV